MSLFQKSVEKKYLNELDTVLVDRKYKDFQNYFGNPAIQENIRNSKEEQFQEGFLRELFVSIFGYTLNPQPNFNLTTELKNIANSKKADGAILTGEHAPLSVLAVIELKGTDTTDLDRIEAQAFGYKNHHPKCVYVITSNFEKLRFYIQNAVDHLDFDLFNLTREQFSLMWLCLAKDNLLNGLPQKIKESSVLQEENITKKLYADYSKFREAIYNNLVLNNPETDKLLLFRKTQKLIDRFLFIFFAEDRLLVPPNSISQIIEKWKDDVDFGDAKPLYHTFKKYFHVLNVGRPKSGNRQEIFAYNGGLFSEDEILDNINIDDAILYDHTLKLSQYNYETDVDVNILGHIFEHSLGDIENVQAEIKGEKVDSQKTKRKKDGIFYTPKYITKYIIENTVGKLCEEKRATLEIIDEEYAKGRKNRKKDTVVALDKKLTEYRNWLLSLTILDPACGSGAFLNQALDFLITEHRKIDDLRAQLFGSGLVFSDITTDILEKNIYGVDINEESVEIAKLSLWLRTAQKGRKLNKLNNNIKCGNSLIDDPEVAGEKAFNWQNEFPNIFQKKNKKAWHITTATHNSRYSQRMFDSFVKLGEPVWLSEKEEIIVSETIAEIAEKDKLNILAYNICGDHAHILLVCEEEELPKIVQKIKSMSARACNIAMGRTVPQASASGISSAGTGTREQAPLSGEPDTGQTGEHAPRTTRGETQFHLWTQKFGNTPVTSTEQLENTIRYIENNRIKHGLDGNGGACSPERSMSAEQNKGACSLVDIIGKITCTREHAFRTEYKGGFDVVVGNPPYVRAEIISYKSFLEKKYQSFNGNADLYVFFFEKSIECLKPNGVLSFIAPNKWIQSNYGEDLRTFLSNYSFIEFIDFGEANIFEGVGTFPSIPTIRKCSPTIDFKYCEITDLSQIKSQNLHYLNFTIINQNALKSTSWILKSNEIGWFIKNLEKQFTNLGNIVQNKFFAGIKTGANKLFIFSKSEVLAITQNSEHERKLFKRICFGKEIDKYIFRDEENKYVFFPYEYKEGKQILVAIDEYPNTNKYLNKNYDDFINRAIIKEGVPKGTHQWFELQQVNKFLNYNLPKIIYPDIALENRFLYDESGIIPDMTCFVLPFDKKYLIPILNSIMFKFLASNYCPILGNIKQGGRIRYKSTYLSKIPFPTISSDKQVELENHYNNSVDYRTNYITLIEKFLRYISSTQNFEPNGKILNWQELEFSVFINELNKHLPYKLKKSEEIEWMDIFESRKSEIQLLKLNIEKLDKEIDQMVYELYGLTEEEIKIVEGAV